MVSVTQIARGHMAITIPQPWAQLTVMGLRTVERRGWSFPRMHMGKPLVIVAGARPLTAAAAVETIRDILSGIEAAEIGFGDVRFPENILRESIMGPVEPHKASAFVRPVLQRALEDPGSFALSAGIGTVAVIDSRDVNAFSRLPADRRHEWQFEPHGFREWATPIPAHPRQSIWKWEFAA